MQESPPNKEEYANRHINKNNLPLHCKQNAKTITENEKKIIYYARMFVRLYLII